MASNAVNGLGSAAARRQAYAASYGSAPQATPAPFAYQPGNPQQPQHLAPNAAVLEQQRAAAEHHHAVMEPFRRYAETQAQVHGQADPDMDEEGRWAARRVNETARSWGGR